MKKNRKRRFKYAALALILGLNANLTNNSKAEASYVDFTDEQEKIMEEYEDLSKVEEYINTYSEKYMLNPEYVKKIVATVTGLFRNENWVNDYYINNKTHIMLELAIKDICEDISNNTQKYKGFFTEEEFKDLKYADTEITYYSSVFELDKKSVEKIIYTESGKFKNDSWEESYFLNGKEHDSIDDAIFDICEDIYFNTERYEKMLTEEEFENLLNGEPYTPTLSPEEMIEKYAEKKGVNKYVALSIAYAECGTSMASDNYLYNNNPAGIGPFYHYLNKEVGIISFMRLLRNGYGITEESGTEALNAMASTYCENPDHWLSLTLPIYYNISENYYNYAPEVLEKKENKEKKQTY